MRNKVILDFDADPGTAVAEAVAYGEHFGCRATVTLMCGPGGYPIVEFVGGWMELDALLTDYYRGTDREDVLRCDTAE